MNLIKSYLRYVNFYFKIIKILNSEVQVIIKEQHITVQYTVVSLKKKKVCRKYILQVKIILIILNALMNLSSYSTKF